MTQPTSRLVGLDLLRGVAIGLVLLRHALPDLFPGAGVVGVVMFFALSGHLITGVLLADRRSSGRIRLGRFYARRATRLLPALVTMLLAVIVLTLTVDPLHDRAELPRTVLVALTWTANLPFDQGSDATFHLWTLATEEQFYLLWPALLGWACGRRGATPRLRLRWLLIGSAATSLLACSATLLWLGEAPDLAYALPSSWAICFVIGAASRLAADRLPVPGPTAVTMALLLIGALSVVPLRGHALTYLLGGPTIAASTAVLVLAARTPGRAEHWLERAPRLFGSLAWLGTVSYAAYLWNYPITLWLRASWGAGALTGLVATGLTLGCAAATWRWVEEPVLRRRDLRDRKQETVR